MNERAGITSRYAPEEGTKATSERDCDTRGRLQTAENNEVSLAAAASAAPKGASGSDGSAIQL